MSRLTNNLTGLALAIVAILGILHEGQEWDPIVGLQNQLTEYRFQAAKRTASGDIVFLAIDKVSLEHVGRWPWPRRVHGQIINTLVESGASEIALDIDFDSASNPEDDEFLRQALERAGGAVVLAAFRQSESVEKPANKVAYNLPIEQFLQNAWPASVNVIADRDGLVRRFPYGQEIAGNFVPSLPSILSGHTGSDDDTVVIDYSIDPKTIPTYSVRSLLKNEIPVSALKNKKILVGAHAVELRDTLAVPVHAVLSGAAIQMLGAETLIQDRSLVTNSKSSTTILILIILSSCTLLTLRRSLSANLIALAAASILVEACAFAAQIYAATIIVTAPVHLATATMACFFMALELSSRQFKVLRSRVRAQNIRHVLDRVFLDNFDAIIVANANGEIEIASEKVTGILTTLNHRLCKGKRLDDVVPAALAEEARDAIRKLEAGSFEGSQCREFSLGDESNIHKVVEYVITPSRLEAQPSAGSKLGSEQIVVCITARDVTTLRAQKDRLEHLSKRDQLTGTFRRDEMIVQLAGTHRMCPNDETRSGHALFVLGVHRFSIINGTFGREIGDALLKEVARRTLCFKDRSWKVARVDGDAFAILVEDCGDEMSAREFAASFLIELEKPYFVEGHRVHVQFDLGISGNWQNFATPAEFLSAAEGALDASKKSGDSKLALYDPSSANSVKRAQLIERHLWRAIERNELTVLYQPQVDLSTREVVGAEALVRWDSKELGSVSPAEFIPIAENSGCIESIGSYVLLEACLAASKWPSHIDIAVNVSSVQIHRGNLIENVDYALAQSGLPAKRLHLELTETAILNQQEETRKQINELRERGITVALDDFGTGYCSFEYLSNLPIDKIKLDQTFVRNMLLETTSAAVIRSIMTLATGMSLNSIAEGIETEEHAVQLRLAGCRQGQGYYFSRPLEAEKFVAQIRDAA